MQTKTWWGPSRKPHRAHEGILKGPKSEIDGPVTRKLISHLRESGTVPVGVRASGLMSPTLNLIWHADWKLVGPPENHWWVPHGNTAGPSRNLKVPRQEVDGAAITGQLTGLSGSLAGPSWSLKVHSQ